MKNTLTKLEVNRICNLYTSLGKAYPHHNNPQNLKALFKIRDKMSDSDSITVEQIKDVLGPEYSSIFNAFNEETKYLNPQNNYSNGDCWPNFKGDFDINSRHPMVLLGTDDDYVMAISITSQSNEEAAKIYNNVGLKEIIPAANFQNIQNSITLNSLVKSMNKNYKRPEYTAFLGPNGNEKPIFLGFYYNPHNQTWKEQFACAYVYIQTIQEFKKNPMCKSIIWEQPQDFIKTESNKKFIDAFKKQGFIKTYNVDTKLQVNQKYSNITPKNFNVLGNDLSTYPFWLKQATGFKSLPNNYQSTKTGNNFQDLLEVSDKLDGPQL